MYRPTELNIMILTDENEIKDYFDQLRLDSDEGWKNTFERMVGINVDLANSARPLLDTAYRSKACGKKIRLVIIDNPELIKAVAKRNTSLPDVLLQIWDVEEHRSLILGGHIREDSDVNWRGERLPLTKAEKVLTSWLLNSSEKDGYGYPIVVEDIVNSVSDKNSFLNVFLVLD